MKLRAISIILSCFLLCATSCSRENLNNDAKKAAELTLVSLEKARDKNLESADKTYLEVLQIIDKYKQKGQEKEFYEAYNSYLEKSRSRS